MNLTQFFDENKHSFDTDYSIKNVDRLEEIINNSNSSNVLKLKKELEKLKKTHTKFEEQKIKYNTKLYMILKFEKLMELSDTEVQILNSNNQSTKNITWNYTSNKSPYWQKLNPINDRSHNLFYDKKFFEKESTPFSEYKIKRYINLIKELAEKSGDELTTRTHNILETLKNNPSTNAKSYFEIHSKQTYAGKIMEKILKRKLKENEYKSILQGDQPLFKAHDTQKRTIPIYNNKQIIINYEEKELHEALFIDQKSEKEYRLGFIEKNNKNI